MGFHISYKYTSTVRRTQPIIIGKTLLQPTKNFPQNGSKESNAIKYYFEHSVAPRIAMTELLNYDPSQTVAPKYANSQYLPELWREILRLPLKPLHEREPKRLKFSSA